MTNIHPLFQLNKIGSGEPQSKTKAVKFDPILNDNIKEISKIMTTNSKEYTAKQIKKLIDEFKHFIDVNSYESAKKELALLFRNKQALIQALLEAAMDNLDSTPFIDLVFHTVNETMSGLDAILVTRLLIEESHSVSFRKYVELKDNRLGEIKSSSLSLKSILSDSNNKRYLNNDYSKLIYTDHDYWLFPFYLAQPRKSDEKQRSKVPVDLPEAQGIDRRFARQIES